MPCCGQRREQFHGNLPNRQDAEPAPARPARYTVVYFEYTGKMGLTVIGPISGLRYRFAGHGARLAVDPRDRPSLAAVPHLRQVTYFAPSPVE